MSTDMTYSELALSYLNFLARKKLLLYSPCLPGTLTAGRTSGLHSGRSIFSFALNAARTTKAPIRASYLVGAVHSLLNPISLV